MDDPGEWFDVVDARDRVIGRAQRREVHARGLLHRAVHVLVQRGDGQVFLQQRSPGKDTHPGCWDSSASGHLDCGESYERAAVRELEEELGIAGLPVRLLGCLPASVRTGQEFVRVYTASHEGPFRLHPEEIADGRWIAPGELADWLAARPADFPPCFHEVWRLAGPQLDHLSPSEK